jgi:hypothetical protein
MTPKARVLTLVAVAAGIAVAGTVGVTLLQGHGQGTTVPGSVTKPRKGRPPIFLDFGARSDREATDLTRAAQLLNGGRAQQAAPIFTRYHSLEAEIGTAFADWPSGSLDAMKQLVATHPQSSPAQFNLGMAYLWSGRVADAARTWHGVDTHFPDSPEAVEAENLLYASDAKGLPFIVTPVAVPSAPSIGAQLRRAERAARNGDAVAKLRYGLVLWQLWHRVSAERQFAAAARLAPADPVMQTVAAVGLFTKRAPVRAFGKLGPLTATFPRAAVVRFHLALLLVWTKQPRKAVKELRLTIADAPRSLYAKEARKLLAALGQHGTK